MERLIEEIKKEIELLESWAKESRSGGWSTHQVKPQLDRAQELKALLYDISKEEADYVKGSNWVAEAEDRSHDRFMNMMGKINPDE